MKKTVLTTTFNVIKAANACVSGYKTLREYLGPSFSKDRPINLLTILVSNGVDDTLWSLRATVENSDTVARLIAADIAESVLHLYTARCPSDSRPADAIQAARNFGNGKISMNAAGAAAWAADRDAAGDAAWAAAREAAGAAARAAWDAAWAARAAAREAARAAAWAADRDAAGAAGAAWEAAGAAREAAAWDAGAADRDAAGATAWAAWDAAWAARAAAREAARAAEKVKQGKIIRKFLA